MTSKNPKIYITNPVTILKLLRNFGYLLKNVYISFGIFNAKFCAEIERYLAEYCSESLHRLSLCCNSVKVLFENLHKPLANVKTLGIYTRKNQNLTHFQFNQEHLPRLKYLYIENSYTKLDHSEPIHFENIEYFTIDSGGHTFRKFPFTFGKLKHLVFIGFKLNDEWCDFVGNIQHLTTLKMFGISATDPLLGKMFESQNFTSNIEELLLHVNEGMFADDILRFLEKSRNLKILTLVIHRWGSKKRKETPREPYDYFYICLKKMEKIVKTIISNLDSKWKFCIIDPFRNPYRSDTQLGDFYCYVIEKIIK